MMPSLFISRPPFSSSSRWCWSGGGNEPAPPSEVVDNQPLVHSLAFEQLCLSLGMNTNPNVGGQTTPEVAVEITATTKCLAPGVVARYNEEMGGGKTLGVGLKLVQSLDLRAERLETVISSK